MSYLSLDASLCNLCKKCIEVCPFGAISLKNGCLEISLECRLCLQCVNNCPKGAIVLVRESADRVRSDGLSQVGISQENMSQANVSQVFPVQSYKGIMVFAEFCDGQFEPVTYELLGKARELADKVAQKVICVTIGLAVQEAAAELLHHGVDKVLVYDAPFLEHFIADVYADVLEHAVRRELPSVLLIGATPLGRSLAPRLAVRLRTGLTADCTMLDIRPNGELVQTRPAFGGNIMATILTRNSRPQMATVRYKVMKRAERRETTSGVVELIKFGDQTRSHSELQHKEKLQRENQLELLTRLRQHLSRTRVISRSPIPKAESIAEAEVIVALGRGVRSEKDIVMFSRLADKLGGMLAASRPLVEKGWFPASRQVGLSGRTVRPRLYIALGISGAIQHVAGMSESEVIIAVNQDKNAQIFEVAHYGFVGDIYEIVPKLLELIPD